VRACTFAHVRVCVLNIRCSLTGTSSGHCRKPDWWTNREPFRSTMGPAASLIELPCCRGSSPTTRPHELARRLIRATAWPHHVIEPRHRSRQHDQHQHQRPRRRQRRGSDQDGHCQRMSKTVVVAGNTDRNVTDGRMESPVILTAMSQMGGWSRR
jgi:hypothetical protein